MVASSAPDGDRVAGALLGELGLHLRQEREDPDGEAAGRGAVVELALLGQANADAVLAAKLGQAGVLAERPRQAAQAVGVEHGHLVRLDHPSQPQVVGPEACLLSPARPAPIREEDEGLGIAGPRRHCPDLGLLDVPRDVTVRGHFGLAQVGHGLPHVVHDRASGKHVQWRPSAWPPTSTPAARSGPSTSTWSPGTAWPRSAASSWARASRSPSRAGSRPAAGTTRSRSATGRRRSWPRTWRCSRAARRRTTRPSRRPRPSRPARPPGRATKTTTPPTPRPARAPRAIPCPSKPPPDGGPGSCRTGARPPRRPSCSSRSRAASGPRTG